MEGHTLHFKKLVPAAVVRAFHLLLSLHPHHGLAGRYHKTTMTSSKSASNRCGRDNYGYWLSWLQVLKTTIK